LIDGLDEIIETSGRAEICRRIEQFVASCNPDNRFIITSRIAGYRAVPLIGNFAHFTINELDNNQIQEIEGLEHLTNLKRLTIDRNQIKMIKALENLTNLQELCLRENSIRKIENLESLSNLKGLFLDSNLITQIDGLKNLPNLKFVSLIANHIGPTLNGHDFPNSLVDLDLWENNIEFVENMEHLENLRHLNFSENPVRDVVGIEPLENLRTLTLEEDFLNNDVLEWYREWKKYHYSDF